MACGGRGLAVNVRACTPAPAMATGVIKEYRGVSSRFQIHPSTTFTHRDLHSERERREEFRVGARAREDDEEGVWASNFLKPSRKMRIIEPAGNLKRGAICAPRNGSPRRLPVRSTTSTQWTIESRTAIASFGNFARILCFMERQRRGRGDLAQPFHHEL